MGMIVKNRLVGRRKLRNMTSKISVIVPVYKVEAYLPPCIESILGQTYTNLEILLVDDGSPDSCGTICDDYAKADPRIRVIHKQNGGLSDARNAALDQMTGDFVTFVDSDDTIRPDMIERLLAGFTSDEIDCVCCSTAITDEDGRELYCLVHTEDLLLDGREMIRTAFNAGYGGIRVVTAWGKLYRASLFEGLRYAKGLLCEDMHLLPYWSLKARSISYLTYIGYCYRQREGSIMGESNPEHRKKRFLSIFFAAKEHIAFYRTLGEAELLQKQQTVLADQILSISAEGLLPSSALSEIKAVFHELYPSILRGGNVKRKWQYRLFRYGGHRLFFLLFRIKKSLSKA